MKLPHEEYCYCLCPKLCGLENDFWGKPRMVTQWGWDFREDEIGIIYKCEPKQIMFGEEVIKPCREDKTIQEAKLWWQEHFKFNKPTNETIEEIETDLRKIIDKRINFSTTLSKNNISFMFSTLCPIWFMQNIIGGKGNIEADFSNAIIELYKKTFEESERKWWREKYFLMHGDVNWWKPEKLDLVGKTHCLVKELKQDNKVFPPQDIAGARNYIIYYLLNKYSNWELIK